MAVSQPGPEVLEALTTAAVSALALPLSDLIGKTPVSPSVGLLPMQPLFSLVERLAQGVQGMPVVPDVLHPSRYVFFFF